MIERIQIQNFQRHGKLRIVFDERITTIVGPSDAGKSSVMRAIRWVAFNRPLGDGFIRNGEDNCRVTLWVDGRKVERSKTKSGNSYSVDGQLLSAVGTEVPEGIRKILNLTSDNFQGQHDSPFWFSLTAGEVAKRLNAIVDLEVIDRSAAWIASRLRKARTELEVVNKRLVEAEQERVRLEFVDEFQGDFVGLRAAWGESKRLAEQRDGLSDALETIFSAARAWSKLRSAADEGNMTREAGTVSEAILARLAALSAAVRSARESEAKAKAEVPSLGALGSAYNMVMEAEDWKRRLSNLIECLKASVENQVQATEAYQKAKTDMVEQLDGTCPLCGGVMK